MSTLLLNHAERLVTMDETRREIADGGLFARDGVIEQVGASADLPADADEVIDLSGHVLLPGLINTHHHLYQNLTRAVPAGQNALLFDWLRALYPIWARLRPEDIVVSTQLGLAELALSGCTLTSDHLYLYPNGSRLDDAIEAAATTGVRLLATRGSMSIGESAGGLPPDSLVEDEDAILEDSARLIDRFHDDAPGAMVQVALAPCSPFSVSRDLMRESAILARDKGVRLHTHLAENVEDILYAEEHFGCRPGAYAEELGWVGEDVWHAHCVKLDGDEIDLFARSGTGVAHCPCSNMRLGSGIAPIRAMHDAGVPVGLGVDGSASNDSAHLLNEARQALLLQRVAGGADAFAVRETLELATRGGARVLGRPDLGVLAPGYRADAAAFDVSGIAAAGAWDPVAALVLCGPLHAAWTVVEGRVVVRGGRFVPLDERELLARHWTAVMRLLQDA